VSRPNSAAVKDIDVDIGKSDIDPPLAHSVRTRGGSISTLPISISFTAALFGLLICFIIASKVVSDVNVIS